MTDGVKIHEIVTTADQIGDARDHPIIEVLDPLAANQK